MRVLLVSSVSMDLLIVWRALHCGTTEMMTHGMCARPLGDEHDDVMRVCDDGDDVMRVCCAPSHIV